MHDDHYEDVIVIAITLEYDFVRTKCYIERAVGHDDIRVTMCKASNV